MRLFSFASVVAVVVCGCGVTVSDRSDFGSGDESVRTYAAGAVVEFHVRGNSFLVDGNVVTATSSDDDVVVVEGAEDGLVTLRTVAAGTAEIVFKQDGDVVDSRAVTVKDAAAITFALEVKALARDDIVPDAIAVDELRVIRGRAARLAVNVTDAAGERLFGQAVRDVTVDPIDVDGVRDVYWNTTVLADGPSSFLELAPEDDAPLGEGSAVVHVSVGNDLVVDLNATAVDEADIERIVLVEENVDVRGPGRRSVVVARAEDKDGRILLGAPGWTLEGADEGIGEAVSYAVAWFSPKELRARIGDVEAVRHIDAGDDTVAAVRVVEDSCAATSAALPLVLLGLLRRARRRR